MNIAFNYTFNNQLCIFRPFTQPYLCSICNVDYVNQAKLNDHMNRHTGKREKCPFCELEFRDRTTMRTHAMKDHKLLPRPPTAAISTETQISVSASSTRKYLSCTHCGHNFSLNEKFLYHEHINSCH